MGFLLKIIEGPNKGAEIALVEGIAVTLGKNDDCDIVLADPTFPEDPVTLLAESDAVSLSGATLPVFHVRTLGSTSFAVGPADAPWQELVREKESGGEEDEESATGGKEDAPSRVPDPAVAPSAGPAEKKRSVGCLGCLGALVALLAVFAALAFCFRDRARPRAEKMWAWATNAVSGVCSRQTVVSDRDTRSVEAKVARTISDVVAQYGLAVTNRNSHTVLVGNFRSRAERLRATAEAYAAQPGAELDFSDDESFRSAAEDALFTIAEGALKVESATNRCLAVSGRLPPSLSLGGVLRALAADLPKLRDVDVSGVTLSGGTPAGAVRGPVEEIRGDSSPGVQRLTPKASAPSLPVCGILTTPYPCLVLRSGARVMEGAMLGDSVVVRIEADAVTVTNAAGRFTWKP